MYGAPPLCPSRAVRRRAKANIVCVRVCVRGGAPQVSRVSGVIYKSFLSAAEAQAWLQGIADATAVDPPPPYQCKSLSPCSLTCVRPALSLRCSLAVGYSCLLR